MSGKHYFLHIAEGARRQTNPGAQTDPNAKTDSGVQTDCVAQGTIRMARRLKAQRAQ
jgi:hypothetical protein